MPFIVKADLLTYIQEFELDAITQLDDKFIQAAIEAAQAEIRMHLYDSFEVDAIFNAEGEQRNALLINFCADIAIYLLAVRCQAGQYIELRKAQYDRAISWLKAAAKTELYCDLPRRLDTVQKHIKSGGRPKRSNYF